MAEQWDIGDAPYVHVYWTKGGAGFTAATTVAVKKPDGALVDPAPTVNAMTQAVLDEINGERAAEGLPALEGLTGRYYIVLPLEQHGDYWVRFTRAGATEEFRLGVRRSRVLS